MLEELKEEEIIKETKKFVKPVELENKELFEIKSNDLVNNENYEAYLRFDLNLKNMN